MILDASYSALVNETIAYLRANPAGATFARIQAHLTDAVRVINVGSTVAIDLWGRPIVVRDGIVSRVLHQLQDAGMVERTREGRGWSYSLTDERKWLDPTW
jgi:hypothetical protein